MANEDGWVYPRGHTYQPVMVEFMSFLHGAVEYEADAVFTRDQVLEIRPIDVKNNYNNPDPDIANGTLIVSTM